MDRPNQIWNRLETKPTNSDVPLGVWTPSNLLRKDSDRLDLRVGKVEALFGLTSSNKTRGAPLKTNSLCVVVANTASIGGWGDQVGSWITIEKNAMTDQQKHKIIRHDHE